MGRSYNADTERAKREDAEVTIGEQVFRPAPQTTELRAKLRKLQVRQEHIRREAMDLEGSDDEGRVDKAAVLDAEAEDLLYQTVSALLHDGEGSNPDVQWLSNVLAPQETEGVIKFINAEDEATPDDPS